ncbi:MAG: methyltransferase domain-containing protein [Gammaproteobacteria bacterium]|nr:MAG: methyltransferase domain-containing protein [Gammaproteobacteria bacterium]
MDRAPALCLFAAAALLTGCTGQPLDPVASEGLARGASRPGTVTPEEVVRPGAVEAIERAERRRAVAPVSDRAARQQAMALLAFIGIQPGMEVLDLYSGRGYYTELLTWLVGESGTVVTHDNTPYVDFARRPLPATDGMSRSGRVERLEADASGLKLAEARFDAALLIMDYRRAYYAEEGGRWVPLEGEQLLQDVYRALKPGGVLGVIDPFVAPGARAAAERQAKRRDPAEIRRAIEAAGFRFEAATNLAPPADAEATPPPGQVVMRFRKPRLRRE